MLNTYLEKLKLHFFNAFYNKRAIYMDDNCSTTEIDLYNSMIRLKISFYV